LALRRDVAPDDLLVFDQGLPAVQKQDLFRQALRDQAPAVLVCPATWVPLSRVLVVDQKDTPEEVFLRRAAALCRGLGTDSIVLTVARTERAARLRQATARETLAGAGLDADFDFLVGAEVRGAVASIARWRRCQLVVMRRQDCPPWWRWLRDPHAEWMMNLTESLSFLSLPGTAASVLPAPTPVVAPAPREPSFAPVPAARRAPAANEPLR
jgi:hypothetical protein